MKILVFGAGGVGSVLGGFLARTGHEVSLLGRPWHLDVVRKNGLSITGIWGEYRIKAFDLYTEVAQIKAAGATFDLILLTVKSYDTLRAVEEIQTLLQENTMVLSLQNGLGNIEAMLSKIPKDQLLAGRVIFGVDTLPGTVRVTVNADSVYIGPIPDGSPKLSAERMAVILNTAKIPSEPVKNILPKLWSKVIYNSSLNAICALGQMPYGKILEQEKTRQQMQAIVRECYAVARAENLLLEPATAEEYIELLENKLIPKTATHFPSMLQDLKRGKKTEIDSLNGAIVQLGLQKGVSTPVNFEITNRIYSHNTSPSN